MWTFHAQTKPLLLKKTLMRESMSLQQTMNPPSFHFNRKIYDLTKTEGVFLEHLRFNSCWPFTKIEIQS